MKIITKIDPMTQADRESLIDSIIEMRFPEYLDAEEAIDNRLALDRSLAGRDSWENRLEQELENVAQTEWSEGSGLTASQHEALRAALQLASELKAMPMHQLKRRYEEEVAEEQRRDEEEAAEERERRAFFNKAEAMADFTYWAKADCWTLEEAVALCLGREPTAVNTNTLEPWRERSKFVAQFERNLDLARRAQQAEALQEPVRPKSFLDWADGKGIEYPAALRDAVIAHQDDSSRSDDGSETTQEIATLREKLRKLEAELDEANKKPKPTLYRIIYVLAAERRGFESITDRDISGLVAFIRDRAPRHSIAPPDDESIRGCLRKVQEYMMTRTGLRSPSP